MKHSFSILDGKKLNLDLVEGRFSAFERVPYAFVRWLIKMMVKLDRKGA